MLFRGILIGVLSGSMALASPTLTKIQDVLYKADGTRFSGIAVISWKTFEASDTSNITTQSITVRIVDGNLRVELVPNAGATPVVPYLVKYNSDGKAQFEENWVVPPSPTPLRVRDVRVAAVTAPVESGGTLTTPIAESDVTGLVADLQARPSKGPGFFPGRAAFINADGVLEAVGGDALDCVRVDGSSGPCGEPAPVFVDMETPSGVVDGSNAAFALGMVPSPSSSLTLYRNGMLQKIDQDYSLTNNVIQFAAGAIPQAGDTMLASYRAGTAAVPGELIAQGPLILCNGTGSATSSSITASLGSCMIPAGSLKAGDRVEIRFDYAHEGTSTNFTVGLRYGATMVFSRTILSSELLLTGRAEAAIYDAGAQLSGQTWGTMVETVNTLVTASDAIGANITIDFLAAMAQQTTDSVALRNFTVIRYSK